MANATQSVIGALNKAVSNTAGSVAYDTKYATYLKLFSGELFKAYESATIAKGTVQNRQLKNGKSLQFIFTGRMQAAYHTPGEPILGSGDRILTQQEIILDNEVYYFTRDNIQYLIPRFIFNSDLDTITLQPNNSLKIKSSIMFRLLSTGLLE